MHCLQGGLYSFEHGYFIMPGFTLQWQNRANSMSDICHFHVCVNIEFLLYIDSHLGDKIFQTFIVLSL